MCDNKDDSLLIIKELWSSGNIESVFQSWFKILKYSVKFLAMMAVPVLLRCTPYGFRWLLLILSCDTTSQFFLEHRYTFVYLFYLHGKVRIITSCNYLRHGVYLKPSLTWKFFFPQPAIDDGKESERQVLR